jgi:hypothetical protein
MMALTSFSGLRMHSIIDPTILFFILGMVIGLLKSDLEIPPQISRFLSLYLLIALGLKGGFALAKSGANPDVLASLGCAVVLAIGLPLLGYQILRRVVSGFEAAAIAATYGSVSAVTFITATQFLETRGIGYGGHMAAAMALMESPAILVALLIANKLRRSQPQGSGIATAQRSIGAILKESCTDGSQLILLGSLLIGMISGESGRLSMQPFFIDVFKGLLGFFLLDMGLSAARSLAGLREKSRWLLVYAVAAPLCHAALALACGVWLELSRGNIILLMVLASSASYIAVPAALRYAIKEASPSLYIGMSLAITFPLNIIVGIPLYAGIVFRLVSA